MGDSCIGLGRHKGKQRHKKDTLKVTEVGSFLSSTDTGHFLQTPQGVAGPEQDSGQETWHS